MITVFSDVLVLNGRFRAESWMLEDEWTFSACGTSLTGGRIKCAELVKRFTVRYLEFTCRRQESVTLSQGQNDLIEPERTR